MLTDLLLFIDARSKDDATTTELTKQRCYELKALSNKNRVLEREERVARKVIELRKRLRQHTDGLLMRDATTQTGNILGDR